MIVKLEPFENVYQELLGRRKANIRHTLPACQLSALVLVDQYPTFESVNETSHHKASSAAKLVNSKFHPYTSAPRSSQTESYIIAPEVSGAHASFLSAACAQRCKYSSNGLALACRTDVVRAMVCLNLGFAQVKIGDSV